MAVSDAGSQLNLQLYTQSPRNTALSILSQLQQQYNDTTTIVEGKRFANIRTASNLSLTLGAT